MSCALLRLAYFLALTRGHRISHITKEHVRAMVALSPLERLQWVRERVGTVPDVFALVDRLLTSYLGFLAVADRGKAELKRRFCENTFRMNRSREAREFGEGMLSSRAVQPPLSLDRGVRNGAMFRKAAPGVRREAG